VNLLSFYCDKVSTFWTSQLWMMMPVPMAPNNPLLVQQYLLQTASFQQQNANVAARASAPYGQQQLPSHANPANVKIKKLPFYEQHGSLVPPSALVAKGPSRFQEAQFQFMLTMQQANDIASNRDIRVTTKTNNYIYQAQLRFCPLDITKEQTDEFPPSICVEVNGKMCPLPNPIQTNNTNVEPKRPPKPIDLSPLCKLSPSNNNIVKVKWAADQSKAWAVFIEYVEKLSPQYLLEKLVKKGTRQSEFTRELIKKKLNDDEDEIATTNLKVTVACPLGMMRLTTPCRPSTCDHLQCFDASLFLQMNERKPTWKCPVCESPALYDSLMVDGYFLDVIKSKELPEDENEIILNQDGSWKPVPKEETDGAKKGEESDDDGPTMKPLNSAPVSAQPPPDIECIDID